MKSGILKLILFFFYLFFSTVSKGNLIEGISAELQILDKITSKIMNIEIDVNDKIDYGTLNIEIYACYKRPPEEIPENFVLIRIYDGLEINNKKQIFQGWMISSSPSTVPFEHPIYDVWLKDCIIK